MINQLLAGVHIAAASEAIAFAAKQNLDIRKVFGSSPPRPAIPGVRKPRAARARRRLHAAQRWISSSRSRHHQTWRGREIPVPVPPRCKCLMTSASGMGRDDISVARMYARVTGSKCRAKAEPASKKVIDAPFRRQQSDVHEHPFRTALTPHKAGFTAVEFLFPYDHPVDVIMERLQRNGLTQALFNLPPGVGRPAKRPRSGKNSPKLQQNAHRAAMRRRRRSSVCT